MGTNLSIMVQIQADTYLEYWDTKSRTMNIYLAWIKKLSKFSFYIYFDKRQVLCRGNTTICLVLGRYFVFLRKVSYQALNISFLHFHTVGSGTTARFQLYWLL